MDSARSCEETAQVNTPHEQQLYAVENQDTHKLHDLLMINMDFDIDKEYSEYGKRPLLYGHLTRRGFTPSPEITMLLIKTGRADVNYHMKNLKCSSIHDALPDHDYTYPEDVINKNWDGEFEKDELLSKYDNLRILVFFGADVNAYGHGGFALHSAAADDYVPAVRFLLNNNASISQMNEDEQTAICFASNPNSAFDEHCNPQMVKILLDYGADPDTVFEDGMTCGAMCAGIEGCATAFEWARLDRADRDFKNKFDDVVDRIPPGSQQMRKIENLRSDHEFKCQEIKKMMDVELVMYNKYNETRHDYGACWSDEDGSNEDGSDEDGSDEEESDE